MAKKKPDKVVKPRQRRPRGSFPPEVPPLPAVVQSVVRNPNGSGSLVDIPRMERQTLGINALRAVSRMSLPEAIEFLNQVIAGGITGVRIGDRIKAVEVLARIGIPTQVEVNVVWKGDWSVFDAEELQRIVDGEHPDDLLAERHRLMLRGAGEASAGDDG